MRQAKTLAAAGAGDAEIAWLHRLIDNLSAGDLAGGVELALATQWRLRRELNAAGKDPSRLHYQLLTRGDSIMPTHNAGVRQRFERIFTERGIALRTLEQVTGSVALATAMPTHRGNDMPDWHDMMDVIADESKAAYRKLVYETPGFYEYFQLATPIDLIQRMRIGSRPSARRWKRCCRPTRSCMSATSAMPRITSCSSS